MNASCIFCKIAAGEIPCWKVYEDDRTLAFLDINPWSPGHTLVIPRMHIETVDACPPEVMAAVGTVLPRIARAIIQVTGHAAFNILNNNRREAGQLVDHVHFHIVPRQSGDRIFSHGPQGDYPEGQAEQLAAAIASAID